MYFNSTVNPHALVDCTYPTRLRKDCVKPQLTLQHFDEKRKKSFSTSCVFTNSKKSLRNTYATLTNYQKAINIYIGVQNLFRKHANFHDLQSLVDELEVTVFDNAFRRFFHINQLQLLAEITTSLVLKLKSKIVFYSDLLPNAAHLNGKLRRALFDYCESMHHKIRTRKEATEAAIDIFNFFFRFSLLPTILDWDEKMKDKYKTYRVSFLKGLPW